MGRPPTPPPPHVTPPYDQSDKPLWWILKIWRNNFFNLGRCFFPIPVLYIKTSMRGNCLLHCIDRVHCRKHRHCYVGTVGPRNFLQHTRSSWDSFWHKYWLHCLVSKAMEKKFEKPWSIGCTNIEYHQISPKYTDILLMSVLNGSSRQVGFLVFWSALYDIHHGHLLMVNRPPTVLRFLDISITPVAINSQSVCISNAGTMPGFL